MHIIVMKFFPTEKLMLASILLSFMFLLSCGDDDDPQLSNEAEITSFTIDGVNGTLEATAGTITVDLAEGTDRSDLTPTIAVSTGATIAPASGVAQDFSDPVEYTVTAEDGTTSKTWTVTVTVATFSLEITPVWQKTLRGDGLPDWFTVNNDRDVAIHGDYVYVHNNGDKIRVMSVADGSDVSAGVAGDAANPGLEFINGKQNFASGTFALINAQTDDNGAIIGSILRSADGVNPWNVYRWSDKDSDQELLISYIAQTGRFGDNLAVVGDVTANGTVYAPVTGTDQIFKFNISEGAFTQSDSNPSIIDLEGEEVIGNAPDVWPLTGEANSDMLITGTGRTIAIYGQDGVKKDELNEGLISEKPWLREFTLDVCYFEVTGRKIIAGTSVDNASGMTIGRLVLIDVTNGLASASDDHYDEVLFTPNENIDSNANGTGGVDYVISGDGNKVTLAAVITNFGVGVFDITVNEEKE